MVYVLYTMYFQMVVHERGMPISCFLNYVEDSREGITDHYTENAYLSSLVVV